MKLKITKDTKVLTVVYSDHEEVMADNSKSESVTADKFENKEMTGVVIGEGYSTIDMNAFKDCDSLISVTIPSSLERIDADAFAGCSALQKIIVKGTLNEVDCWFGNRRVAKITLHNPSSDYLVENLKKGYAMDLYFDGRYRDDFWD